jgi:hypothetical protein
MISEEKHMSCCTTLPDMPARRLLIIACTATKRPDVPLLPAYLRYLGTSFRILRRWIADHPNAAARLDVAILSAEFGLIPAIQPIPDYDRRMTPERAEALRGQVCAALQQIGLVRGYAEVFISAGAVYRLALADALPLFGATPVLTAPAGAGIGRQLAALKQWLSTASG